jgi:hypothetical protein
MEFEEHGIDEDVCFLRRRRAVKGKRQDAQPHDARQPIRSKASNDTANMSPGSNHLPIEQQLNERARVKAILGIGHHQKVPFRVRARWASITQSINHPLHLAWIFAKCSLEPTWFSGCMGY